MGALRFCCVGVGRCRCWSQQGMSARHESSQCGQESAQQRLQMLTSVKYSLAAAYCDVGRHQTKPLLTGPLGKAVCYETWLVMCTAISTGGGEGGRRVFVAVCMHTCSHTLGHLGQSRLPAGLRQRPCNGLSLTQLASFFTGLAAAVYRSDGPSARGLLAERTPSWQLP